MRGTLLRISKAHAVDIRAPFNGQVHSHLFKGDFRGTDRSADQKESRAASYAEEEYDAQCSHIGLNFWQGCGISTEAWVPSV